MCQTHQNLLPDKTLHLGEKLIKTQDAVQGGVCEMVHPWETG